MVGLLSNITLPVIDIYAELYYYQVRRVAHEYHANAKHF